MIYLHIHFCPLQDRFGHSFVHSVVTLCPEMHLQKKPNRSEVRAASRKRERQVRDKENAVLNAIIPRQILGDSRASVSSYLKRRQQQYFERPQECGKVKSHSPSKINMHWDIPTAMDMLRNWPSDTKINWSIESKKMGIPGSNSGQVLKETAIKHGIDTVALDSLSTRRIRARKWRLPGSSISVGCGPSKKVLKSTWVDMIQSG